MKKGLTLIELLLVFSLVAILATTAFVSFSGTKMNQALFASGQQLEMILQRARIYSRDQKDYKAWGVVMHDDVSFDLVSGSEKTPTIEQTFYLESPTKFSDHDFAVWFDPGEGTANQEKIVLINPKGRTIEVHVSQVGLIELKD